MKNTKLNAQQAGIVAEFCTSYRIEPEDITFFDNDPQTPFFGYEASCVLLNELTDIIEIEIEPVAAVSPDTVSRRCRLVFPSGSSSFIAAANVNEKDDDGKPFSPQQIEWLADSRAIRGAIRTKGLNLLRLHWDSKEDHDGEDAKTLSRSPRSAAIAQAHILGNEVGLIVGKNKSLWYQTIDQRYGVRHAGELDGGQLADFIAFMQALKPKARAA